MQNALRNLAKDLLACSAAQLLDFSVDGVQAAAFTELHSYRYRGG